MKKQILILTIFTIVITIFTNKHIYSLTNDIYYTQPNQDSKSFELTVVGKIWEEEAYLGTIDVRKYKMQGNSPNPFDNFQAIPDLSMPTYYGSDGSLTTLFTPRGDKVNISINDLDISTLANSTYDASILDPVLFDSATIYYGPSSSRYGSGNYGGIVNFEPVKAKDKNTFGYKVVIGSYELYDMGTISLSSGIGKFYAALAYSRSENNFNFDVSSLYTNDTQLEKTNYTRQGAEYKKYSAIGRYTTTIGALSIDSGIILTLPTVNEPNRVIPNSPLNYEKATSKLRFLLPYLKLNYSSPIIDLGIKTYYTENVRNRNVEKLQNPLLGGSIGSHIMANKFSLEVEGKTKLYYGDNLFLLGTSLNYSYNGYDVVNTNFWPFLSPSTNESKTNVNNNIIGGYLELNYLYSSLLQITLSTRIDNIDLSKYELSPRVGLKIKPLDFLGIRGSGWIGYRLPYFDDIYGPVAYGYGTSPLTNLKTEYVKGIDAGIFTEHNIDQFYFYLSLTPYYTETTNLLAFNTSTFTTENIGKALTRGINIETKLSYKSVSLLINYTYTEPINWSASEYVNWNKIIFLNYRPLNNLFTEITYDRGYIGISGYINYQWNKFNYTYDSFFNVIGNIPLDDVLTLSTKFWAKPKENIEVGVEWTKNFIGNEYIEGFPIPEEKIIGYLSLEHNF
ncbi:MAG: TonB-dependent receptor domain-containing protein [Brevinematia bacterium]